MFQMIEFLSSQNGIGINFPQGVLIPWKVSRESNIFRPVADSRGIHDIYIAALLSTGTTGIIATVCAKGKSWLDIWKLSATINGAWSRLCIPSYWMQSNWHHQVNTAGLLGFRICP